MYVVVDIEKMLKLGISAEEYVLLDLVYTKRLALAKKVAKKLGILSQEFLDGLVARRVIHNMNNRGETDLSKIIVRGWAQDELANTLDYFDEFIEHYPRRVTRPDGTPDYLRADISRSKEKYNKLVKNNPNLHQEILNCLKKEVSERTRTGKLMYMKRLPKWLASEEWLLWKDSDQNLNNTVTNDLGYGLSLE